MERAVAACPEVEVLFQGIPINCLIDTGSQVTTITESFFRRLSYCNLLDVGNWIRVTGANDLAVPCLGYIEVEIRISGILVPQVGVLVVKDPVDPQGLERKQKIPGLLGSNFFSALKKCMAQQTCAVNIDEKISQMLSLYEMSVDSNDHGTSFVKVAGSLRVKVPASSMVVVQGITMLRSDGKPYSVAV